MTDIKLLALLNDYYNAQRNVILCMYWAMEYFERGRDGASWAYLFEWCVSKDHRDELFFKFKNNYGRAVMLKEGFSDD